MKRWCLTLAVMFGGSLAIAYADSYLLIRAVLGGKKDGNAPGATPGAPTGAPPGAPPGAPGPRGPDAPVTPPGAPGAPRGGDDVPTLGAGGGEIDTLAMAVQAVVRINKLIPKPGMTGVGFQVTHKWSASGGATRIYNDDVSIFVRTLPMVTMHSRFESRRQNAFKGGNRDKILELAEWAIVHGLVDEFAALMDDLVKSKEDQNASAAPALREAVKAYAKIKAELDKNIDREDRATYWKNRLSARSETSKHYAVIYTSQNSNPPEVQSRLAALERHMKAFYFWFALKGMVLPVPDDKLVAVMLDQPSEFRRQRTGAEELPLVNDGFYAARDHICVFSAQRLDGPFQVFLRQTAPLWQAGTYERTALLDGTAKRKVSTTPAGDFARMMTLALLEKALEDEAERASVTHEGTQQLMVAVGLLPRTVVTPQWIEFGSAACFETPKGPFPGAPPASQVAIFPGVMAPSWAYLRPVKEMLRKAEEQTKTSPGDILRRVVTDGYFNAVINASDRQALLNARASAWALSYYLMKARFSGMERFFKELAAMPRDLEMDDKALLAAFARAFDIANSTQDGVDPAKFEQFAKDWIAYIKGVQVPGAEFGLEREVPMGAQPGQPGQPGGDTPTNPQTPGRGGPGGGRGGPGGGGRG